jgi:capsular polysaccharide transport system permease protein
MMQDAIAIPLNRSWQRLVRWTEGWSVPALLRRRTFAVAAALSLLAALYWGIIASDRYVSEAHVIVQRTDMGGSQSVDFSTIISGVAGGSQADQFLLRDYLLSVDMLEKLDARLDLRGHYSDSRYDILSRMWDADREMELFYRYYLSRVSIEFDERAGILVIRAQAYEPQTATAITTMLVEEGERYMNELAHRLASEQVSFLEQQVVRRSKEALEARQKMIAFQNSNGMVSPQGTVESRAATINKLEGQLTELKARRGGLLGYLSTNAPAVVELNLQIEALQSQIEQEQARLASPEGTTLNVTVEEYQRLQSAAEFAHDVYNTALVALEKGRVEATRMIKKVSILQAPTKPQYPLQPRRLYNLVVFVLVAMILAGIIHLLAAIIRDHKD